MSRVEREKRLRQEILADLLAILRKSQREHWYQWVVNGRPTLSQDEYERERVLAPRRRKT
mgnify:FL=1